MRKPKIVSKLMTLLILASFISVIVIIFRIVFQKEQYIKVALLIDGSTSWSGDREIPYWLANTDPRKKVESSLSGKKIVEVTNVQQFDHGYNRPLLVEASILVNRDKKRNTFRFRQQPLEIGTHVEINPGNINLIGRVIAIEGVTDSHYQPKNIEIIIKLYDRFPWIADNIHIGDKSIDDLTNNVGAEIIDKKVTAAEMTVVTSSGKVLTRHDLLKRNIELKIRLNVIQSGGFYYLDFYKPIRVNSPLNIHFPEYDITDAYVMQVIDDISPNPF